MVCGQCNSDELAARLHDLRSSCERRKTKRQPPSSIEPSDAKIIAANGSVINDVELHEIRYAQRPFSLLQRLRLINERGKL